MNYKIKKSYYRFFSMFLSIIMIVLSVSITSIDVAAVDGDMAGSYFFNNERDNEKYIHINNNNSMTDEGEIIELHKFNEYYAICWDVVHVSGEYYKIESQFSRKVLTAPTGSNNYIVTQTTYSGAYTQQWKFIAQSDGTYKISPRSNLNYFLTAGDESSTADQDLEIRTNRLFSKSDEWRCIKMYGTEGYFLGISDTGHDHERVFGDIAGKMHQLGCNDFSYIIGSSKSLLSVQNGIANAKIFVSRSHGGSDTAGTYIVLGSEYLGTSQVYNYSNNSKIVDLSNCDLLIFVACKTANHETKSLVHAAVAAGADVAIGFKQNIGCVTANLWLPLFFEYYLDGDSPETAARKAAADLGNVNGINSFYALPED